MIVTSPFPPVTIPEIGIHEHIFSNPLNIPQDHVLLVHGITGKSLTYGQICKNSKAFGLGLKTKLGFKTGEVLAIYSENCLAYSTTLFGVLCAGGVVTPANPSYTTAELTFQLKDSSASYLVTTISLLPKALESARDASIPLDRIFVFDDDEAAAKREGVRCWQWILAGVAEAEAARVMHRWSGEMARNTTAYLCYSSGTTGKSKGVMLTHFNVVANIVQCMKTWEGLFDPNKDVSIAFLPFYHAYALNLTLHMLCLWGVKSVILPAFNFPNFLRLIQQYKITFLPLVPPVCLALAKDLSVAKHDLSSMRLICCAAAPLSKEIEDILRAKYQCMVVQVYGMTELSPASHLANLQGVNPYGSVGVLVPNMDCKVMSPDGQSLGLGKDGEIWVRGPNVMKGYLNNEAATRETIDENGWLHTGDVGHFDEQGNFYIVDRLKELIKYNGFQVAPAELEALLLQNPKVADCVVIGVYSHSQATELPLAFVVPTVGHASTPELAAEIQKFVEARIARHKWLRGGVRFVDTIPKSPAGKILRRIVRDWVKNAGAVNIKPKL